jgi:2-succinyl-5-enolpyruvyl-6-hydroxy-3-cyclohexene-1-carboxylate synthase
MTDTHPGNISFKWTSAFFRTLQRHGVQHIVISPGSRSTPLTLAIASNDHFQKHVILDERSAAFTALGIGKATNLPAVLICTSGTALANYHPAVIEARKSGVPMILATADRPPHLRATGANQAIDQLKIFGDYPVFFHEVGEPSLRTEDLKRLQILGKQAVTMSQEKRGPVHLNFPFRKPLEPTPKVLEEGTKQNNATPEITKNSGQSSSSLQLAKSVQQQISKAQEPLIIVGPLAPGDDIRSIANLASQTTAPILSESTIDHPNTILKFEGFLRNSQLRAELNPDLILRFGFQPTCKSLELGLTDWNPNIHYHFASSYDWHDATLSGADRIPWMGQRIRWDNLSSSADPNWLEKWKSAAADFGIHYEKSMNKETELTDGTIYRHLTPQISEDFFITVSNSFPARDIYLFGEQPTEVPLYMNRGVSGIDGVTSTAIGLSLTLNQPGILFTGDLAFLHDTNALLNNQKVQHPLLIVVINNSGGSIFRMLPIEQYEEYFTTYFETPQSVNLQKLTGSYDIPYRCIESRSELQNLELSNWMKQHSGLSVIECKTDADASMKIREKLWDY